MTEEETGDPVARDVVLDELDELVRNGATVKSLKVKADSGGAILRGMLPMFEMVASESTGDDEARAQWWRSFCVEAHLICLEHVGIGEAAASFMHVAELVKERIEANQSRTQ